MTRAVISDAEKASLVTKWLTERLLCPENSGLQSYWKHLVMDWSCWEATSCTGAGEHQLSKIRAAADSIDNVDSIDSMDSAYSADRMNSIDSMDSIDCIEIV